MSSPVRSPISRSSISRSSISRSSISRSPVALAFGGAVVFVLLLAPFLNLSSIGGSSEARETHVASIVRETGEWVLPLRNGVVPSKPILFHWVTALLGELRGGVTPGVARATSLLFGAGTLALTVFLGGLLGARTSPGWGRPVALVSGFVLASTYGFIQLALDARVDMTYTFFVVLALAALLSPFLRGEGGRHLPISGWGWAGFYGACGFGVLAKGPIGLVLPLVIGGGCVAYLVGIGHAVRAFLRPRFGWVLFLALAVPWYLAAADRGSAAFLERQLFFENLQRFTGAEHMNNEPPWFYLESFLRGAAPWSLLALIFGCRVWRRYPGSAYTDLADRRDRMRWIGAVWFLVGAGFLSLASGKRHSYLLPLFPGLAIFLGLHLVEWYEALSDRARAGWARAFSVGARVLTVTVLLVLVGVWVFVELDLSAYPGAVVIQRWIGAHRYGVGVAAFTAILIQCWIGFSPPADGSRMRLGAALTTVWLLGFAITAGYGVKSELKGFDRMALEAGAFLERNADLVLLKTKYNEYFDPFLFYLGRTVRIVPPERSSVRCPGSATFIARRDWFDAEMSSFEGGVEEVVTVYQRYDALTNRTERGITLFRCRANG